MIDLGRGRRKCDISQFESAKDLIVGRLELCERNGFYANYAKGCYFLGELYIVIGQKDKARENLGKALSMMDEMGMMYWPDRAREVLARL